jgi:hypothetical protein
VPVLLVGDVPEVDGVGGREVGERQGLRGEQPLALDAGAVGADRLDAVGEHVVGVEAEQEVRAQAVVVDAAGLLGGQTGEHAAAAAAVEGHGLGVRHELHRAADPGAGAVEVPAAGRRADAAQLRVDLRAVVTLVIIFEDQLPVGGELVGVGRGDPHAVELVVGGEFVERAEPVGERLGDAGDVGEHEAAPDLDAQRDEVLVGVVAAAAVLAGEVVGPAVVGAADLRAARALADLHELVGAVAADVGEAADGATAVADQQEALAAGADGSLTAGLGEFVGAADAHPGLVEQVLQLPAEDVGGVVGLAREAAAGAEW